MSGARAAEASEALPLGLTSMMAWLGRVPRRAAGGRVMYRTVVFFSFRGAATVATSCDVSKGQGRSRGHIAPETLWGPFTLRRLTRTFLVGRLL